MKCNYTCGAAASGLGPLWRVTGRRHSEQGGIGQVRPWLGSIKNRCPRSASITEGI